MTGVACPICGCEDSNVVESRPADDSVVRRRKCKDNPEHVFRTEEKVLVGEVTSSKKPSVRSLLLEGKTVTQVVAESGCTKETVVREWRLHLGPSKGKAQAARVLLKEGKSVEEVSAQLGHPVKYVRLVDRSLKGLSNGPETGNLARKPAHADRGLLELRQGIGRWGQRQEDDVGAEGGQS